MAGAVSSRHLRRWLVAIVMIVGITATGAGWVGASTLAPGGGEPSPNAIAVSDPGWSRFQGIMPVQPRMDPASGSERGIRVRVAVLISAMAAASLAFAVARRTGFCRQYGSLLPLALRARSLPRRAPPLLQLG